MNRVQCCGSVWILRPPRGGGGRSDAGRERRGQDALPERSGESQEGFGRRAVRGLISPLILVFLLGTGCADIKIRMGNRPNTDELDRTLRPGESTRADVLAALGEPYGKGRAMLPIHSKPRTMWSYYYGEATMQDLRRVLLFVYFDEDRYDGYMWFSSLQK